MSSSVTPSFAVTQIRVVAALNAVQGFIELGSAFMFGVWTMLVLQGQFPLDYRGDSAPQLSATTATLVFGGLTLASLAIGGLRLFASLRNWRFRGRTLGIVSFVIGLASCLGSPLSVGVLVYGLFVFFHPAVAQAFQRGQAGEPADKILGEYSRSLDP